MTILLGVNVDHVATLRQARGTAYPDPVEAARQALYSGADYITVHLREDRRHIQDRDVARLIGMPDVRVNLEMAATEEMLALAEQWRPEDCCLVPERRQELTTEGGLDVRAQAETLGGACARLADAGVRVSLFVDPDEAQLRAAAEAGAPVVELHTGVYADAANASARAEELARVSRAATVAAGLGLVVNAGHGLHYENTAAVAAIGEIAELNIGHAIVAQAIFDGFPGAVRRMKDLMEAARGQEQARGRRR
ncbi:MAG: pyridoxine 5'-phosphate synthase [Gammaproteobacteria bacterium]|nr:pyridoxine 5'-phosphate synthase [Gammaproteobacteria bacterium]MXZ28839.1 pyridoxine 5'-phosphate synthase [Gammaproteobacteria bacterium]MYF59645.1 pyridoxine 5'-phosphate synthase [Gammaproteobacteria bacterium]